MLRVEGEQGVASLEGEQVGGSHGDSDSCLVRAGGGGTDGAAAAAVARAVAENRAEGRDGTPSEAVGR